MIYRIYHESYESTAAYPEQVRPCHWILQTETADLPLAECVARRLAKHHVHAKITSNAGTTFYDGRIGL